MAESALQLWPCEIAALDPPDIMSVSEWANANITLLPESSPRQPGPYRWQRTPYARAVMDLYKHPDIRHIVLKWATQLGKTQVAYNILGYIIDQDPYSTMLVYPSEDEGKSISRLRVQPMINASPTLSSKIPANPKEYQLLEMHFPGMVLYISSGSGTTSLEQRPIRNLIRDEVNKYPEAIGEHGDPMKLSEQRLKGSWDIRKILDVSSPTHERGNITRMEEECQVILLYCVPCPYCGHLQALEWKQLRFDNRQDLDKVSRIAVAKSSAVYICRHCEAAIGDEHKDWMLSQGGWYDMHSPNPEPSQNPIADLIERYRDQGVRLESVACRLSSLYSPWLRWADIVEAFMTAHLADWLRHDKLRSFTTDWLANEWVDKIEDKAETDILKLRCDLPPLVVPEEAIALTAGIDCQKKGMYFTVWAWGPDMSSWLIHYGYLPGWDDLTMLIYESAYRSSSGRLLPIWRAAIDTGGTENEGQDGSMTDAAYTWLARWGGNTAYGVKGASRITAEKVKGTIINKFPGTQTPIPGVGVKLWVVDTGYFKDLFHSRLQTTWGQPGAVRLHQDTGMDYASQIVAEEKRRDARGVYRWQHVRGENHYLDATIYASFLAHPLCMGGLAILRAPRAVDRPQGVQAASDVRGGHRPQNANGRGDRW